MNNLNVLTRGSGTGVHAMTQTVHAPDKIIDNLPVGVFTCDRDGYLVQFNRRAAELWGRAPELKARTVRYFGAVRIYRPDGSPLAPEQSPVAQVLRTAMPLREHEVVIERADGSRLYVLADIDPLFDANGSLIGAIDCFQDITRQKQSEQAAKEREQWYRDLLEALPAAIYTTDPEGRITFFNQAAVELSGQPREEMSDKWCVSWRLHTADGLPLPHEECPMAVAVKENRAVRNVEAVAERPDGSRVPFMAHPTPLRNADGEMIGAVNMLVDITERKAAEERQKVLIGELNHRVKNTLATVQALAAQTMRGDGVAKEMREAFSARLLALSRAHDELTRGGWQWADLRAIFKDILAPFGEERIRIEGDEIKLSPKTAVTLAMVLHELAINAAKFGALSTTTGRVSVSWALKDGMVDILWNESGGPKVIPPQHKGFGSRLVERGVAGELKGSAELAFQPSGVQCHIVFPFAKPE